MKIWAHTLVRNEERYIWFSVMSVINYVDKILIWDTGSTDNTVSIIREIKKKYPEKIDFKKVGKVDAQKFTEVRQEMLDITKSDWFLIVDGDEVWWDGGISKVTQIIRKHGNNLETIVNGYFNIIGDIYHYQEEKAGKYKIDGKEGHLTIRAINRSIPGLHFGKPHGIQGIFDKGDRLIQERDIKKRMSIDESLYLHFTHMIRSKDFSENLKVMKRDIKFKHELGFRFPLDFYYPEVLFRPRPTIVPSPWEKMNKNYILRALIETPLRKFKRRVLRTKSGY